MPELLLEVGTEELPATAVHRAYRELADRICSLLVEARVLASDSSPTAMGTPRRLIVSFADVAERQEDSTKEQRGPGMKAAYDEAGNPTPALLGFCRSQGVEPADLRNDGQYVWVTKVLAGTTTLELLKELLPKAIAGITFDKTMRWGAGRLRFARPIRWLLAAFGGALVPFEIEGVSSGLHSFGHRFYAPDRFDANSLDALVKGLRQRKVEPDPIIRERIILEEAASASSGVPDLPSSLVSENVYLTEWPTAIEGGFSKEFLDLPTPVLVTAMAKHEKMFPVRDAEHALTNRFVFIRNAGEDESVRHGCEWVLNARFNDAKFFFDEDRRRTLGEFLDKTSGIVFQEKLGTIRQRCDRLSKLGVYVAPSPVEDEAEVHRSHQAGLYSKADLATGLVSELASLQGIVGGEYARREGFPGPVCWAIETQYDLGQNLPPVGVPGRTAVRLVMADQLDKLAGYLGIGLEPSGSSDPFALRRAASLLIEAAWNWPDRLPPFSETIEEAFAGYRDQGLALDETAAKESLRRLFASRYASMMPGVRHDVLDAALLAENDAEVTNSQSVRFRVNVIQKLADDVAFVQTATRPLNIVNAAAKKGESFERVRPLDVLEPAALQSDSGTALLALVRQNAGAFAEGLAEEDLIRVLRTYPPAINRFFEETMVMADDPNARFARLTLAQAVSQQLLAAGDFSKLVIEAS
ncbi:MAG TPA: glycine--tRNA ligase subunit beta [Fimbriimonas sp.]|nr:glycine--tRNA ligase subunit beta [Fimbriimonas sp.]